MNIIVLNIILYVGDFSVHVSQAISVVHEMLREGREAAHRRKKMATLIREGRSAPPLVWGELDMCFRVIRIDSSITLSIVFARSWIECMSAGLECGRSI